MHVRNVIFNCLCANVRNLHEQQEDVGVLEYIGKYDMVL